MIICKHPKMIGTKCFYNTEGCCRHCEDAKRCINMNAEDDDYLCPYIKTENDLKYECPFESV